MNQPGAPPGISPSGLYGFVVRIEAEKARPAFCGTGFLVSPVHVATCSHVADLALTQSPRRRRRATGRPPQLAVRCNGELLHGSVVAVGDPDCALIRLERPIAQSPVRLLVDLRAGDEDALVVGGAFITGFAESVPNRLVETPVKRIVNWLGDAITHQLCEIQIEGGRREGLSGSPVLVLSSDGPACLGMLCAGGEDAVVSRFMLAGGLLEMMQDCGAVYPMPLNARDVLGKDRFSRSSGGRTITYHLLPAQQPAAVTAPALPSNYLPRPDVFLPLKRSCLEEKTERPLALTGLKGMGGVGKTVLARALCHDPAIQSRFPDGVIWVTVGRHPTDLAGLVRGVLAGLQVPPPATESLEAACALLRTTLHGRACLIVLDDIWSASHVLPFRVNAPRSCLLFTTRNGRIVNALGGEEYSVDALTREEALGLLAAWTHLPVGTLPGEAYSIVDECGRLPLSLAIVGSLLRGKANRWGHLLRLLGSKVVQHSGFEIDDYTATSLWRVLAVSLDELPSVARERYLELGVFREDAAIPEAALRPLWKMGPGEVADLVDLYVDLSLATRLSAHEILLHDLLVDYIHEHGPNLRSLHRKLLTGYKRMCSGPWHTGPSDGYFFQNLAYHLIESGWVNTLCRLLLDFNWLQTKLVATDIYSTINDFTLVSKVELQSLRDALRLSIHVLLTQPFQLSGHLRGRLSPAELALVKGLRCGSAAARESTMLVPLAQSLTPPGGELELTLSCHLAPIIGVDLYDEGRKAITASEDSTVRVWDLETGSLIHTLRHSTPCTAVAAARVGWRAVSAAQDGNIKVWDVISGAEIRTFTSSGHPRCIAVNATGSLGVSGSEEGWVELWDLATGRMLLAWEVPGGPIRGLDITADGRLIATVSKEGKVDLWNAESLHLNSLFEAGSASGAVAIAPDASRIAFAKGGTAVVFDMTAGSSRVVGDPSGHMISALTFTERGNKIVTGSDDAVLGVWSTETGAELKRLRGHGGAIRAVAATELGDRYISAGFDRTLRVWNPAGRIRLPACSHLDITYGVSFSSDSSIAASASADGTIGLWRPVGGRRVKSFLGHEGPVNSICIGVNDQIAASACDDRTVRIWDLRLRTEKYKFSEPRGAVQSVAVAGHAPIVAASSWDFALRVWDVESGALLQTVALEDMLIRSLALSDDGSLLLSGSDDKTVVLWDAKAGTKKLVLKGHEGPVNSVTLPTPAALAVSASDDGTVRLWDLKTGSEQRRLQCSGAVFGVAASRGGRLVVATAGCDVIVFDADNGAELCRFSGDSGFTCCAVTPNGRYIAAGDGMGAVHFFRLYHQARASGRTES